MWVYICVYIYTCTSEVNMMGLLPQSWRINHSSPVGVGDSATLCLYNLKSRSLSWNSDVWLAGGKGWCVLPRNEGTAGNPAVWLDPSPAQEFQWRLMFYHHTVTILWLIRLWDPEDAEMIKTCEDLATCNVFSICVRNRN